jgi:hypothetical protein
LTCLILTGVLSSAVFVDRAQADDGRGKFRSRSRTPVFYDDRDHRHRSYFPGRDVTVLRDYYRPYYRPLPPGLAKKYYRTGSLPRGWEKRMRRVPVYVERDLYRLPRHYHRGFIDGRAIVYDGRGMIIDVAVLF